MNMAASMVTEVADEESLASVQDELKQGFK